MRNWVTVDLEAVRRNLALVRECAGGRPVLAVVKANAYGLGAPRVARFLARQGCERLAVATTEEALALREAGLRVPIHILAGTPPADYERVAGEEFVFTIGSALEIDTLARAASRAGSREIVHLEVDTGMGRSGCGPGEAESLVRRVLDSPALVLEGAMTHFPSADDEEDPEGADFAREQVKGLLEVGRMMVSLGVKNPVLHAANSAGLALVPESHLSFVRPGGVIYGLFTGPRTRGFVAARPALAWRATVSQVREFTPGQTVGYGRSFVVERPMTVATVAVGYGDGYARAYGPGGSVLVRGRRARIVGRVSMDSATVDVTGVSDDTGAVSPGEEVVLIGVSRGGRGERDEIRAEDLARLAGVSPYEVTCRIAHRVPRLYLGG